MCKSVYIQRKGVATKPICKIAFLLLLLLHTLVKIAISQSSCHFCIGFLLLLWEESSHNKLLVFCICKIGFSLHTQKARLDIDCWTLQARLILLALHTDHKICSNLCVSSKQASKQALSGVFFFPPFVSCTNFPFCLLARSVLKLLLLLLWIVVCSWFFFCCCCGLWVVFLFLHSFAWRKFLYGVGVVLVCNFWLKDFVVCLLSCLLLESWVLFFCCCVCLWYPLSIFSLSLSGPFFEWVGFGAWLGK